MIVNDNTDQTLGDLFNEQRRLKSLSVKDVAEELKISEKYIFGLENNDYTFAVNHVFLQGYIKNYARLLDINTNHAISLFEKNHISKKVEENYDDIALDKLLAANKIKKSSIVLFLAIGVLSYFVFSNSVQLFIGHAKSNSTIEDVKLNSKEMRRSFEKSFSRFISNTIKDRQFFYRFDSDKIEFYRIKLGHYPLLDQNERARRLWLFSESESVAYITNEGQKRRSLSLQKGGNILTIMNAHQSDDIRLEVSQDVHVSSYMYDVLNSPFVGYKHITLSQKKVIN